MVTNSDTIGAALLGLLALALLIGLLRSQVRNRALLEQLAPLRRA
jgi:hypothetical protein